jgi:hypothetical protein
MRADSRSELLRQRCAGRQKSRLLPAGNRALSEKAPQATFSN